jgi:hypothetical protein
VEDVEDVEDGAHDYAARIERLESQVRYLLNYLELDPDIAASGTAPFPRSGGPVPPVRQSGVPHGSMLPPDFHDYLRRGKLISAIKIYREVTGASLIDAKAAVDAMYADMVRRR